MSTKNDSKQLVFSLIGDIHAYITDPLVLADFVKHCTNSLNYTDSQVALAGYESSASLPICNNAAWALGEMFTTCQHSALIKNAVAPFSE